MVVERQIKEGASYAASGVNLKGGDDASKAFYNAARKTWEAREGTGRIIAPVDDFSGLRYIDISGLEGIVMGSNTDGIGTKTEIAERLGVFNTVAHDLVAMVCDDTVIRGAVPIILTNIADVSRINPEMILQMALGLQEAAIKAGVAVINGEIAELGAKVGGYGDDRLNWGASVTWFARKDRLITGKEVRPGDYIVALKENGFRSNGLSLVRKILEARYGEQWHQADPQMAAKVLTPSGIYSKFAVALFGGFENEPMAHVAAMANITGGGVPGKLGRVLKVTGFGAELISLFDPSEAMLELKLMGNVATSEAYSAWNMGNGFLVITKEPEKVVEIACSFGFSAKIAGSVTHHDEIVLRAYDKSVLRSSLE